MGSCCSKGRDNDGVLEGRGDEEFEVLRIHDYFEGEEDCTRAGEGGTRVRLRGSSSCASMYSQQGWKGINQDAMTIWEKEHLMIANLGDSRAILCSRGDNNQLVPVQLTVDLKPNLPSEEERITSCRGRVFSHEEEPDVYRIWLPDEDCPGLAMSRPFGDFCLKDFGLISTPQVSYRKLSEQDEFVVLATDGVWDVLSNKEVIKIVSTATKQADAAKHVVQQSVRTWRSKHPSSKVDDCAAICLFLKPPPPLSAKSSFSSCHLSSAQSHEFSFTDSFKTARSEEPVSDSEEAGQGTTEDWTALEGVSRANSLMKLPRFASVLSWSKKSVKVLTNPGHECLLSM